MIAEMSPRPPIPHAIPTHPNPTPPQNPQDSNNQTSNHETHSRELHAKLLGQRGMAGQHIETPTDWRPPRGLRGLAGYQDNASSHTPAHRDPLA